MFSSPPLIFTQICIKELNVSCHKSFKNFFYQILNETYLNKIGGIPMGG